ncbi:hypothetical protein C0U40_05850 [Amylibacter cionae]|nr:hypothetical protein C0U40_05850 [Amylibacter cionae]
MKLFIKMADGKPSLFSTTGMYSALLCDAALEFEAPNTKPIGFTKQSRFKVWEGDARDNEALSRFYPRYNELEDYAKRDPMLGLYHHTLFHHVIRNTYIVADTIPSWAKKTSMAVEVAPILKSYSGWSICLDEQTYQNEWQEYLLGRKQVYSALEVERKPKGVGRPKMEAARSAFEAMGFERGKLTWEQLARKLERETGEKPSHKAMRNWQEEHQKED